MVVVGIEHRRAPMGLLEALSVGEAEHAKVLGSLRECSNLQESVLLSTCLRTEVYAVVDRFHDAVGEIEALLASVGGLEVDALRPFLGIRFDADVPAHLFAVASGLESAVVGESEVLGQVRRAWERAHAERVSGPVLAGLFRHAVHAGKRVRTETGIGRGTTSFAHAAVEVAGGHRPGGLGGARVLVLGAGQMATGLVGALAKRDDGGRPAEVVLANRNLQRAVDAAAGHDGLDLRAAPLEEVPDLLLWCDVALAAVQVPAPVIGVEQLARRSGSPGVAGGAPPLVVVDLGVPRNVDPEVAGLAGVTLVGMEGLQASVDAALGERLAETAAARAVLDEEVGRYGEVSRARGAAPVVAALRSRLEDVRLAELERRLGGSDPTDDEWQRVDALTRAVLAKVLHEPTVVLKETAGTPRGERLVEALRTLFDL
ncbi:MAG TPA: glutamyl-tRNA reductase [Acidimicrobiales bacterium]